jgi:outer membrane protein assembly factor BamD
MKCLQTPVLILGLSIWLSACSLFQSQDETEGWSAQRLQSEAKSALNNGNFEEAIRYYEALEARYPLGRVAQQAQLDIAYAYYKFDEPESAIAAADRFIKLYPTHAQVDYAHYLKGLANFNQNFGFINRYLPLDLTERDQAAAKASFKEFKALLDNYPDSKYADDARQRMVYLRDNLARYELHVADYYMRREAFLAAARRAQYVVKHYDGTAAVGDALVLMVKAYRAMRYEDLAADALKVLKLNYPNHPDLVKLI